MNGMELLEKMERISPAYIEEADKPFRSAKRASFGKITRLYAVGMAAGFVLMLVSVGMLALNGTVTGTETGTVREWTATALAEGGSLPLILLIASVVIICLCAFLLFRRRKRD